MVWGEVLVHIDNRVVVIIFRFQNFYQVVFCMLLCTSYYIKRNLLRVTWALILSIEFIYLVVFFVSHIKENFMYDTF